MKYKKSRITKQHIVYSAIETINKVGIENASINKILENAKVSKGGFYYHFDNFDSLMDAILMEVIQFFFEDFALNPEDITKYELKYIGKKIINSSNDNKSMASIFFLFISKIFTDSKLKARVNTLRKEAFEMEISNMGDSKKNVLNERFINFFDILVVGFLSQAQFTDDTDLLMELWDELVEKLL